MSFSEFIIVVAQADITVTLISGELSSISHKQLEQGGNLALIGKEIVQFAKAELIGKYTYRVGGFVRGKYGTEEEMKRHQLDENFILLNERIYKVEMSKYEQGQKLTYLLDGKEAGKFVL